MNPELQQALAKVVESAQSVGAAAWDQAPLVLRDLVVAGIIRHGIAAAVLFVALVVCVWGVVAALKQRERYDDGFFAIMWGFFGLGAMAFLSYNVVELLTAVYAPRAFILVEVSKLIR